MRRLARQMIAKLPANVALDDLIQVGTIGLSDALTRFDAAHGVQFETFATQRIRGAMLDELRGNDWMSRGDRRQQRSIEAALRKLEQTLGRAPQESEIAAEMGLSLTEYQELLGKVRGTQLVYLEDMTGDDGDDDYLDRPLIDAVHGSASMDGQSSNHRQMRHASAAHGARLDAPVKRHQAPTVAHRQRQQIYIGDLPVSQHPLPIESADLQQAHVVGPELVFGAGRRLGQALRHLSSGQCTGIGRLRQDADAAVLSDRARRPARTNFTLQPRGCQPVVDVPCVEQSDQHVDIEQRAHLSALHATSDAFSVAQRVDLVVGDHRAARRKRTEATHGGRSRLGLCARCLARQSLAQQLRHHLAGRQVLPARQLFGGVQNVIIDVHRGSHH